MTLEKVSENAEEGSKVDTYYMTIIAGIINMSILNVAFFPRRA